MEKFSEPLLSTGLYWEKKNSTMTLLHLWNRMRPWQHSHISDRAIMVAYTKALLAMPGSHMGTNPSPGCFTSDTDPSYGLGRQQKMAHVLESLHPYGTPGKKLLAPGSWVQISPTAMWPFGEWCSRWKTALFLLLTLKNVYQIKIIFTKKKKKSPYKTLLRKRAKFSTTSQITRYGLVETAWQLLVCCSEGHISESVTGAWMGKKSAPTPHFSINTHGQISTSHSSGLQRMAFSHKYHESHFPWFTWKEKRRNQYLWESWSLLHLKGGISWWYPSVSIQPWCSLMLHPEYWCSPWVLKQTVLTWFIH